MQDERTFGPVQLLAVAFEGSRFKGEILPELERLKNEGFMRIVDLLVVRKDGSGGVAVLTATDLDWEEATQYGAYIGTMIGVASGVPDGAARGAIAGAAELADGHVFNATDVERLTSVVPDGSSIAIILLEHLWALPLIEAIERAGGYELANDWVGPEDLMRLGLRREIERTALDGGLIE